MKAVSVALLVAATVQPADQPRTYLLSLCSLPVGPEQYISAFSIETWGVTTLATCQIPPGWTITAGSSADRVFAGREPRASGRPSAAAGSFPRPRFPLPAPTPSDRAA